MYKIIEEYGYTYEGNMSDECYTDDEQLAAEYVEKMKNAYLAYMDIDDELYCRDWDQYSTEENERLEDKRSEACLIYKFSYDYYNVEYEKFIPEMCNSVDDISLALNDRLV